MNIANYFRGAIKYLLKRDPTVRELQEQLEKKTLAVKTNLVETLLNTYGDIVQESPLWDAPNFFNPYWTAQQIPPTLDKTLRGEILPVYVNWYGLKLIRDYSRYQCQYNPYAMCAIENRCSYISGRGFQYKLAPKNDQDTAEVLYLCRAGQQVIDQFHSSQRWSEREHEAIARCDRDGEAFLRFFHVGGGRTEVRTIEPEWVRGPSEEEWQTYGIINTPGDVEDIIGYWVLAHPPYVAPVEVPADEIIHLKLNSDSTSKRGLPTTFPVRSNFDRAQALLRNMSVLAAVQATFAVIRQHEQSSATAVQGFQTGLAQVNGPNAFGTGANAGQYYAYQMQPGTVLDVPANVKYEFPSHGIDAGALVAVLQAELRAIAARLVMPEYMLTANADGSNFASIAIAESPSIKNFERMQTYFARRFGSGAYAHPRTAGAMWRVLHNAVEFGGLPREILSHCELQVEGPSLIARNKGQETTRYASLNQAGILSKGTWSKFEGLDREQERRQCEKEQSKDVDIQGALQNKQALLQSQTQINVQNMQLQAQLEQQAAQAAAMAQNPGSMPVGAPSEGGQELGQQQVVQQQGPQPSQGQELSQPSEQSANVYNELHDLVGGRPSIDDDTYQQFFESIQNLPSKSKIQGPSGQWYEIQEEEGPDDDTWRKLKRIKVAKENVDTSAFANITGQRVNLREVVDPNLPKKYFHGTSSKVGITDRILPSHMTGVLSELGRKRRLDRVFLTPDVGSAKVYAGRAVSRFGGEPRIYHAYPVGEVEKIHDIPGTGVYHAPWAYAEPYSESIQESQGHSYATTQYTLPPEWSKKVLDYAFKIVPDLLAEKGIETEPHITILYGLERRSGLSEKIQEIVKDFGHFNVTLGKVKVFDAGDDGIPLYIEVESERLVELHHLLKSLPNKDKWPTYKPHICIAYMKATKGYEGDSEFSGQTFHIDHFDYRTKDGEEVRIRL